MEIFIIKYILIYVNNPIAFYLNKYTLLFIRSLQKICVDLENYVIAKYYLTFIKL